LKLKLTAGEVGVVVELSDGREEEVESWLDVSCRDGLGRLR
jgi:hypothetical protein